MDLDLLPRISRLFRLLDLFSEASSAGYIDKIIIDHVSMGDAMNTLRDGSYKTIRNIDFAALDGVAIKPVGLYGSKSALIETLMTLGVVDKSLLGTVASAEDLPQPVNRNQLSPSLRSGIYLFIPPISSSNTQAISSAVIYLIYWPEDETWNDDAPPSVQKNRVSFMRYLTKLTPDISSLISEEHAAAFVWKYDDEHARGAAARDSSTDDESDDDDRFVKFKVKKSGQEEECVQIYPGFTFIHPLLGYYDPQSTKASPVPGETSQAFMVSRTHLAGIQEKKLNRLVTGTWLRSELAKDHNVYLGEGINENIVQILFDHGAMRTEATQIYHAYKTRKKELEPKFLERKNEALSKLQSEWPTLKKHAELLIRRRFSEVYSTLQTISQKLTNGSEDSLEYLTRLCAGVPKARTALERYRGQRVPTIVDSREYKSLKDRFIDVTEVLRGEDLTEEAQSLIDSIASPDKSPALSRRANTSGYEPYKWMFSYKARILAASSITAGINSSRPGSGRPRSVRSSLERDDVEFLRALEEYESRPAFRDVVRTIKNAAIHWIESRIWDTSDDIAGTLQNLLESFSTEEAFKLYCDEEFNTVMVELRRALIPYISKSAETL
ncbi:hypothetical protein FS837_000975, partial [Tulasnella sp. UAMH 9824]